MLIPGYLQNATVRVMSRSLHRVEDKFDRLTDALLKLSEASCFSQPSATAVEPVALYAYPPPAEHITLAERSASSLPRPGIKPIAPYTCPPPAEHIALAEHSATSLPRPAEHNDNRSTNGSPHLPISTTYYPLADLNQSVPLRNLQIAPQMSSSGRHITIELGEMKLTFDPAVVPDPPTVTYADDIDRLVQEWTHSSRLVVAGQGIPVRYWDKLYAKRAGIKVHAWSSLRSTWGNWKVSSIFIQ